MRTNVRRATASSQTTTGSTRTTSSSLCTTNTPMTNLTSTIAWCTSCIELAHGAHWSTLHDDTAHLIGSSPEQTLCHPRSYLWCTLFDSTTPIFLYFSFLSFSVYFLHHDLFRELDNPIVMAKLRCSADIESEDALRRLPLFHMLHRLRVVRRPGVVFGIFYWRLDDSEWVQVRSGIKSSHVHSWRNEDCFGGISKELQLARSISGTSSFLAVCLQIACFEDFKLIGGFVLRLELRNCMFFKFLSWSLDHVKHRLC